jgi:hypothetical protein
MRYARSSSIVLHTRRTFGVTHPHRYIVHTFTCWLNRQCSHRSAQFAGAAQLLSWSLQDAQLTACYTCQAYAAMGGHHTSKYPHTLLSRRPFLSSYPFFVLLHHYHQHHHHHVFTKSHLFLQVASHCPSTSPTVPAATMPSQCPHHHHLSSLEPFITPSVHNHSQLPATPIMSRPPSSNNSLLHNNPKLTIKLFSTFDLRKSSVKVTTIYFC